MRVETGIIEQIGTGELGYRVKRALGKDPDGIYDTLCISNKESKWLLDLFNDYKKIGCFKVKRPHNFLERQKVKVFFKKKEIVKVEAVEK